jgi:vacuolar-type H+-ATPase subunit H
MVLSGGDAMNSTLKVQTSETRTLIEKIKAEIRKRAETKARRMLLKAPKKQLKRTAT